MEKFTKHQKNNQELKPELKYDGYLKILSYKDGEMVDQPDMVIILPYLKDSDSILIRVEPIPSHELAFPEANTDKFITIISGTMEEGETPEQTVRRELYEEAGIVLSSVKNLNIETPVALSKGNKAKYYCCYIELGKSEYKQTVAPGDGTNSENNSRTISIPVKDIEQLNTYDLITRYMLTKFKLEQGNDNEY
jgi:8-oxo-dGTP pyrophosphatase MutT (NUDIX family)